MTAAHHIDGVLVLYHRTLRTDASTVVDNIAAFRRHSRFPVFEVNTDMGFPAALDDFEFSVIALHYSLFSPLGYYLNDRFLTYLRDCNSYKVAFFQDEHHYCRQRFAFLDAHAIDCVYTMLEPGQVPAVYGAHTNVRDVVSHLPGYVSPGVVAAADQFARPASQRSIDIGYRGRALAPYMGRGAREKYEIGIRFRERAESTGLALDIKCDEIDRIYGDAWSRFIGDCRAFLGTESGVSVFDLDDTVRLEYEALVAETPGLTAEEYFERWSGDACEERIPYRTLSPRHLEAAAFGTAQILYEGRYSGAMEPWVHYIPLRKDFSNFDEVIEAFRDERARAEIVANAHRDLIASGDYGYERFIAGFDEHLHGIGLRPSTGPEVAAAAARLDRSARIGKVRQRAWHVIRTADSWPFPGRARLVEVARPALMPILRPIRAWADPARRRSEPRV
jgi:hypothetical protein